jgi:hypothetical protein
MYGNSFLAFTILLLCPGDDNPFFWNFVLFKRSNRMFKSLNINILRLYRLLWSTLKKAKK